MVLVPRESDIQRLLKDIDRYQSFITQLSLIVSKYCAKHSDLVNEVAALRINFVSDAKTASVVSVFDSPLESVQDMQLSKTLYRKIAMLVHPDRGGSALLFNYAHALYLSHDVSALSILLESLMKGDFSSFAFSIRQKLNALYEVTKAKPSYKILVADLNGDYQLASDLTEKYLKQSIEKLKSCQSQKI